MANYRDAKQGGDLSDMAAAGTAMPNDAGNMNTIPSKLRPEQISDPNDLGSGTLAGAADNAADIPRSTRDQGLNSEIVTATGDTLPAQTGSKRMHDAPGGVVNDPHAKGHSRYERHIRQEGSDQDIGASDGPGVQEAAGMENMDQEQMRERVDGKDD